MAFLALAFPILSSCGTSYLEQSKDQQQNATDVVRSTDLQPRFVKPDERRRTLGAAAARLFLFWLGLASSGTGSGGGRRRSLTPRAATASRSISTTARSPMSPRPSSATFWAFGYTIDPRAQGTITLSSGRPIAKKDMLFVLEDALRANNLLMVREGAGYRIVPDE